MQIKATQHVGYWPASTLESQFGLPIADAKRLKAGEIITVDDSVGAALLALDPVIIEEVGGN